jgi:Tfp pilus assembly protein PilN
LRNVELSAAARRAGAGDAGHVMANLVGLAAMGISQPSGAVGLLPAAVRAVRASRRRQRTVLVAAALLFTAVLPAAWYLQRAVNRERAKAEGIAVQLPPMRALAQRNQALLSELSAVKVEIAAVRRVLETRTSWIEFLADLEERLGSVGDAWLEQLSMAKPAELAGPDRTGPTPCVAPALQLRLAGRFFDVANPTAAAGGTAHARVKALLASIAASPFVASLGDEHFDASQPGTLCFAFTLTMDPARPL